MACDSFLIVCVTFFLTVVIMSICFRCFTCLYKLHICHLCLIKKDKDDDLLPKFQDSASLGQILEYICAHQRQTEHSNVNTGLHQRHLQRTEQHRVFIVAKLGEAQSCNSLMDSCKFLTNCSKFQFFPSI